MQKMMYQKYVLKGSHYNLGYEKGKSLKATSNMICEWLTSPYELPDGTRLRELSEQEAEERCRLFDMYDKGLGDEVRGLAAGMQVPLSRLNKLFYGGYGFDRRNSEYLMTQSDTAESCNAADLGSYGACSVVGVSGTVTDDGHSYIAQSYEFGYEDEYSYMIEQAEGSYSHMGFAFYQVGRFDGINEKGLYAGITCLDFVVPSAGEKEGFSFSFIVRIILDTCATVEEVLSKLHTLPICTNANIIFGDRSGAVVNVELQTTDGRADIAERKAEPFVYGFNHFLDEEHKKRFPQKRGFTYVRELAAERFISEKSETGVSRGDLQKLLTEKLPDGLCCHAYKYYFGTLRSMLCDLAESAVYVAFGSPQLVPYTRLTLEDELQTECGCTLIPVCYEAEETDSSFWKFV